MQNLKASTWKFRQIKRTGSAGPAPAAGTSEPRVQGHPHYYSLHPRILK